MIFKKSTPTFSPIRVLHSMRNRHFLLLDCFIFILTPILSLVVRLEGSVDLLSIQQELVTIIVIFSIIKIIIFFIGGLYQQMWQHASVDELVRIGLYSLFVMSCEIISYFALSRFDPMFISSIPRSIPFIDSMLTFLFVGGIRFSVRIAGRIHPNINGKQKGSAVLVVGAGDAGVMIVQEIQSNPQIVLNPVGFVDDDPHKTGLMIRGIRVLGNRDVIPELVTRYAVEQIIIAMPGMSGKVIREIDAICRQTGVKTRIIPGVFELLDGSVSVNKLRDVVIDDLLRREPVMIDDKLIRAQIGGKRILITGAGGSIGSELCRQLAHFKPAQIILMGHGENSIFSIANELGRTFPETVVSPVIADVRDKQRVLIFMKRYKPELVYHAAAHKHVPLMELNPAEAVTNNIIGTQNLVDVSNELDVERFVLISTDKVVNPTSVMGAAKRVAELIVQGAAHDTHKVFVAVRFGNVLGSRGSVIPTFKEQIARGGPVTVTHPDVKRYFMTIPEAVQLVLQAGTTSIGGKVFVLDMGEPVKIVDLAKDLIRLSGTKAQKDIEIVYTGLRSGEKLFEELAPDDEHFEKTAHEKIFVLRNGQFPYTTQSKHQLLSNDDLRDSIEQLRRYAVTDNAEEIRRGLKELVPEYQYYITAVPI